MPTAGAAPGTHGSAPGGGAEPTNDTISARLGINAVYGPFIGRSGRHCIQPNGYNEGADQFVSDIIVAAHRHGLTVTTRLDPRAGTRGLGVN